MYIYLQFNTRGSAMQKFFIFFTILFLVGCNINNTPTDVDAQECGIIDRDIVLISGDTISQTHDVSGDYYRIAHFKSFNLNLDRHCTFSYKITESVDSSLFVGNYLIVNDTLKFYDIDQIYSGSKTDHYFFDILSVTLVNRYADVRVSGKNFDILLIQSIAK